MASSPQTKEKQPASLRLTAEQEAIIRSGGDIRINAVAGSGKTTTIVQYAATRPAGSRILYLAYNRSVKTEAVKRFAAQGLHGVRVETAHSLAFKPVVVANGYKVRQQDYKIYEIAELLGLQGSGEKHGEYILANHIHKFAHYFCNSRAQKVQDLNYLDIVQDEKAKAFVRNFYSHIEQGTRILLGKMYRGEIDITHDFYLKRYQLMNPVLPYDYILFDEGQDASPAMLDIFLNQKATRVIVGDTHQQIYAWRHAVNSLESAGFQSFDLSTSFRFHQDIANLAKAVLSWKEHLQEVVPVTITGKGEPPKAKTKATLARTNLGLLVRAITFITEHPTTKHLYFEGNINSYTYADDGASLYDVLSLYNNNPGSIRDPLVRSMKTMEELEDYIEKTEDVQLAMMVELVEEYGNEIPGLIRSLKSKHVSDEEKDKAEMIFSTVHRAKGMEYDAVQLVEDFVTEQRLQKLKGEAELTREPLNLVKWNEEINLLYVALTRTKGLLRIPESLLPKDFPPSPHIQLIQEKKQAGKNVAASKGKLSLTKSGNRDGKANARSYAEQRLAHKNAYSSWTADKDAELIELYVGGADLSMLADYFGCTKGAIFSRLKKLGYWED
jgi:superfamily I DNA/RNA helicase